MATPNFILRRIIQALKYVKFFSIFNVVKPVCISRSGISRYSGFCDVYSSSPVPSSPPSSNSDSSVPSEVLCTPEILPMTVEFSGSSYKQNYVILNPKDFSVQNVVKSICADIGISSEYSHRFSLMLSKPNQSNTILTQSQIEEHQHAHGIPTNKIDKNNELGLTSKLL